MGSKRKTTAGVSVPVGFRFHPTEEELLSHYLKKKNHDLHFKVNDIILEIDICNYDPWDLPGLLVAKRGCDDEWFFFSPRDYKYNNSTRSKRTTPKGYWKITGQGRDIKARRSKAVIGRKRTLTFYTGRASNSKKTNWVMHEYHLNETQPNLAQRDFVLCRVKKNSDKKGASIRDEGEPSSCNESNCSDQVAAVATPESQDYSSTTLPSPTNIELEDVLQANGINDDCYRMQSPFGDNNHSVTDNNDISTCDEGEHPSLVLSDDMIQEPCARPEKSLELHIDVSNEEYQKSHENESCSYIASDFENQAAANMIVVQPSVHPPTYSELRRVVNADTCNDDWSKWQSTIGDNYSDLTHKNNTATNDFGEQVSIAASNYENQDTYESNYEVYPRQEESLALIFCSLEEHDYTLPPLMSSNCMPINTLDAMSVNLLCGVTDSFPEFMNKVIFN